MEEKIGIIDLGSNSARLVLMKIYPNQSFKLIDEIKETTRLGAGLGEENLLQPESIKRTVASVKLFTKLCRINQIDQIIAVATAAVRNARNQEKFLEILYIETGIKFRVLTGEEEAYYVYQGVVNSLALENGLIVDIGGGSTELILMKKRKLVHSISLPFGAVTLTEKFLNKKEKSTAQQLKKLEGFIQENLQKVEWLAKETNIVLLGIGGTIRNIAKINRRYRKYPLELIHNYTIGIKDLQDIYQDLKNRDLEERKKVPGLSKERADIIIGGMAIIEGLSNFTKAKELVAGGNGLREGLFYNYLLGKKGLEMVEDVLEHSLENFMLLYDIRKSHAQHVYKLVLSLYDQLQQLHKLGQAERKLLRVCALLHDCGISINYYNHSKHTFYLLLNSRLNGFSHRELVMAAFICTLHDEEELKKKQLSQYKDLLSEKDYQIIYQLGILLRIGTSLDRSATGIVETVHCQIRDKTVEIETVANSSADLEIYQATRSAEAFRKVYEKQLLIK